MRTIGGADDCSRKLDDERSNRTGDRRRNRCANYPDYKRAEWEDLIEQYLNSRPTLCGVIQIIDLRHPPQPLDLNMSEWLNGIRQNYIVVGNKADKEPKGKIPGLLMRVTKNMNIDSNDAIAFSAQTGLGRDQLWQWIISITNGIKTAP